MKIILDENDIKRILSNHLECDPDRIDIHLEEENDVMGLEAVVEVNNVRVED